MQATRLIVIRHGETAWNVDMRIQGHLDVPLNDTGHWQAGRLAQALASEPFDAIYASDLSRAHATALALGQATGVAVQPEQALRERHFGALQGRTFSEIEAEHPDDARRWRAREPGYAPPGGESLLAFRDRITSATHRIAARHIGGLVALVAHGGVLDVLYRAATGQDPQTPRTWQLSNASINRLLWADGQLTLVGWSDTHHLDDTASRDEHTA